jgi:hypothetical protein
LSRFAGVSPSESARGFKNRSTVTGTTFSLIDQLAQQLQPFYLAPRKSKPIIWRQGFPVPQRHTV